MGGPNRKVQVRSAPRKGHFSGLWETRTSSFLFPPPSIGFPASDSEVGGDRQDSAAILWPFNFWPPKKRARSSIEAPLVHFGFSVISVKWRSESQVELVRGPDWTSWPPF